MLHWLPWAPLVAAGLHMTEEFVFPGGFPAWFRRYHPDSLHITPRFLFWINAALALLCLELGLYGSRAEVIPYWLGTVALLASNGIWHVWAAIRSRAYSPGMITGLALYVPLAIYGYFFFLRAREASIAAAVIAAIIGGSYQFWDALFHGGLSLFRKRPT